MSIKKKSQEIFCSSTRRTDGGHNHRQHDYIFNGKSFDRFYEFIKAKPEFEEMDNLPEIKEKPEDAHLQINNLSFRFIGRKKLFEHISMEIKKGEIVTFFGEIGSGKSTLIQTHGYSPNVSCRNF